MRGIYMENSLEINYPKIAKEWDYSKNGTLNPNSIAKFSNKKVWWVCSKGHSYEATVSNRTNGRGCPYCTNSKVLKGYNDLKSQNPYISSQWNYEKNGSLLPENVLVSSSKKVWWICEKGHEWETTISSRTKILPRHHKFLGCPYCANKKVWIGYNDLKTTNPDIASEWNYEKNGDLLPTMVTAGSGKRVWWKCKRGHEWQVAVCNRLYNNCPTCSCGRATSMPEQAIVYYLSKYFEVKSRVELFGYEVDIYLPDYSIAIEYDGIRYHHSEKSLERELKKDEILSINGVHLIRVKEVRTNQSISDERNVKIIKYTYTTNYCFYNIALNELADYISEITQINMPIDIDYNRDRFEIRKIYERYIEENSLLNNNPSLCEEWDYKKNSPLTPDMFSLNAHDKVWWKCKNGHSWPAEIASRVGGRGCPYCAGQRVIEGENDLYTWALSNNKDIITEWFTEKNNIKINEVSWKNNNVFWWKCVNGHEWRASVANRVNGTGCPKCNSSSVISKKRNKISFRDWCNENNQIELLNEWDYSKNKDITPDTITYGSHAKIWWKCKNGHSWEAVLKSRRYNHGCPYCSPTFKKAVKGKNDLVTWCKENNKEYILFEWDDEKNGELRPENYTFGSHARIWWKCSKGHSWQAVIKERTKEKGNTCPICKKL